LEKADFCEILHDNYIHVAIGKQGKSGNLYNLIGSLSLGRGMNRVEGFAAV
jgi:hypothetical protein